MGLLARTCSALLLLAGAACGARTGIPIEETPSVEPTPPADSWVPPAPACALPASMPTVLYTSPDAWITRLALDAEAVYFTDPFALPAVTRVSKCDGTSRLLAPPPSGAGTARSLSVVGKTVAWIKLDGIGGDVLASSIEPGGDTRVLVSTGQPLSDSIGLDDNRAFYGDGAIKAVSLLGGAPVSLWTGWGGIGVVDEKGVYFNASPPTDEALRSVAKGGGPASVLVPSVHVANGDGLGQDDGAIYWLQWNDFGSGSAVMRISKGGGDAEVIVAGQDSPSHLAVDDAHVYFTVGNFPGGVENLVRSPKTGGASETIVAGPVIALAVDARTIYYSTGHTVMKLDK